MRQLATEVTDMPETELSADTRKLLLRLADGGKLIYCYVVGEPSYELDGEIIAHSEPLELRRAGLIEHKPLPDSISNPQIPISLTSEGRAFAEHLRAK